MGQSLRLSPGKESMANCFWKTWPGAAGRETQRGRFRNQSFLGNHSLQKCVGGSFPERVLSLQQRAGTARKPQFGQEGGLCDPPAQNCKSPNSWLIPRSLAGLAPPSMQCQMGGGKCGGGEGPRYSSRKGNKPVHVHRNNSARATITLTLLSRPIGCPSLPQPRETVAPTAFGGPKG